MSKAKPAAWANRIVGYGEEAPDQLLSNEANWRVHPKPQQDALGGVLDSVGVVQNIIVNKRLSPEWGKDQGVETLVDGHLRVQLALRSDQPSVPVTYVDLTPNEEALILATLDPLAAMAATDKQKLDDLMREVQSDDQRVQALIENLAIKEGMMKPPAPDYDELWKGMPEFEQENLQGDIVRVHFEKPEDKEEFFDKLGIKHTDKTNSIWYPERPEALCNQLGHGLEYTGDES